MEYIIEGKAWVIRDRKDDPINNIDTEQIFPRSRGTDIHRDNWVSYIFHNLSGWNNFYKRVKPGDIIICGKNFGTGAPHPMAVDCFRILGISLMIAESFAPEYRRLAVNKGFPVLICPDITSGRTGDILMVQEGDILNVDMKTGEILNSTRNLRISHCLPASPVQLEILEAGSLHNLGRSRSEEDSEPADRI